MPYQSSATGGETTELEALWRMMDEPPGADVARVKQQAGFIQMGERQVGRGLNFGGRRVF